MPLARRKRASVEEMRVQKRERMRDAFSSSREVRVEKNKEEVFCFLSLLRLVRKRNGSNKQSPFFAPSSSLSSPLSDPSSDARESSRVLQRGCESKAAAKIPALSDKHRSNKTMAEALNTRELVATLADDDSAPLTINDLPKELLVSVFIAVEDPFWVRRSVPCVCRE